MGQKILVVEDNELNLKLFCDLLRAHGYAAEPVRDGREAVARARAFAPDLVVMDIQMPHITGLELIEQMKGDLELRPIPIMAVTAYAAKGDEERIREAGAEGYVSKPISVMKFVEAVRTLLAVPRREPEPAKEPEAANNAESGEAPSAEDRLANDDGREKLVQPTEEKGSTAYYLFAWAIENRTRILCLYDGVAREICPVVLGETDGKEMARVYQIAGESSGALPGWRTFELAKVSEISAVEGGWLAGTPGQQQRSSIGKVDYDANPDSPFGPTRSLGNLQGTPLSHPVGQG